MVKRKYETKTYTKREKVLTSEKRYCDVCKKEITGHFWEITTGHYDWGNDSVDSVENKDCCSIECLGEEFGHYLTRSNGVLNSEYISVEHCKTSGVRGDITYDPA